MQNSRHQPIRPFSSKFVLVERANVDTDQIVPARFLTATKRAGMGEFLFYDWRYDGSGEPIVGSIFNQPTAKTAKILVAGDNFGCGSSREHAPWALLDFGFRAVLSTDFADIFRSNALKNGLLPVVISKDVYAWLCAHPDAEVSIDLEAQELRYGDDQVHAFKIEPFARLQLLAGMDDLDFLLAQADAISAYEAVHEG